MKKQQDVMFLQGKRLYLRPVRHEDLPLFLKWANDPELRALYMKSHWPTNEVQGAEWITGIHKRTDRMTLVICLNGGRNIGMIGIHSIDWKNRVAMTETVIGEKQSWGKGYGGEAKMILLHYAFDTLNLYKICAAVYAFNKRSVAYNTKCGYKVEGVQRRHVFADGEYHDRILMAIFREEWLPVWKRFLKTGRVTASKQ